MSQNTGISFWAIIVLIYLFPFSIQAQDSPYNYDYPYQRLPWYTLESEHFLIHFRKGNSRSAQVASRIAEEVYPFITELYNLEPDSKTNIVLKDREDYSNGAAYFFDNQIDIWVPALNSPLRGTNNWLRNVISHEFTHIIQLEASMKRSRKLPSIYFQWLSYEDVRRPDVLYGYPNGIITYPFSSISVPAWFAEGVAQYQRTGWTYDTWDSYRDMVLRTAVLNNNYLSFEEMSTFSSKNSLQREQIYNQGFAFTSFLALQYGESVFSKISEVLSEPGVNNIDTSIKKVTGKSGHQLFDEWIAGQKTFYKDAIVSIYPDSSTLIESKGFFNFYPSYSPDGSKIAYLSNKNISESEVSLYVKNVNSTGKGTAVLDLGEFSDDNNFIYSCGFSDKPLINRIRSAFSFSPDGSKLVFTRTSLNQYGERYNDLFVYDFKSKNTTQLTYSARLNDPEWSPDGQQIAAVQTAQGTNNLVLVDPDVGSIQKITFYEHGEQLFSPAWHPDSAQIYFSFAENHGRSILRVGLNTNQVKPVLNEALLEYRDPFVGKKGQYLYYSADPDGIFNIYRIPLQGSAPPQKLTSVTGGAFMPNLNKDNKLVYSEYRGGGYKIISEELLPNPGLIAGGTYQPVYDQISLADSVRDYSDINNFDDSDLDPLPAFIFAKADTGEVTIQVPTKGTSDLRRLHAYDEKYTSFSFYPVIRFDNYSKLNGSNASLLKTGDFGALGENLLRDLKIGTYFSSREINERLNIYGGVLFGIASQDAEGIGDFFRPSRLTDLDRDLFLITEYRGLPFIKKRWSPTLSLELYNMRRNVKNGLSIEEFPCTSCLPDTTAVDVAYNIWEADLFLRSKINAHSLVELSLGYTPYKVQTDNFYSQELQQLVLSSSTEYYRGTTFSAGYIYESFLPYPNSDTAPIGLSARLKYSYQPSKLLNNFKIENGILSPTYKTSNNHSVELSSRYGVLLGKQSTVQLYSRFFSYLNNPEDPFYRDYIGGFNGMRSYPYFSITGNTTAFSQLSYILPIFTNINKQIGQYTFDKLFLRLFGEVGDGWNNQKTTNSRLKTGVGAELRFAFNNYYLYPLKFFISGAYGFSKFDATLPDEFITTSASNSASYGRQILIHFGLTFDFETLNHD